MREHALSFSRFLLQTEVLGNESYELIGDLYDLKTVSDKLKGSELPVSAKDLEQLFEHWAVTSKISLEGLTQEHVKMISYDIAKRYQMIVLQNMEDLPVVVMANPFNTNALESVKFSIGDAFAIRAADSRQIELLQSVLYPSEDIQILSNRVLNELKPAKQVNRNTLSTLGEHSIDQLLQEMFRYATVKHATDIHIELDEETFNVRYRIENKLSEAIDIPLDLASALRQRLLIISEGDIVMTGQIQDLGFEFTVDKAEYGARLSYVPTAGGYSIVIRVVYFQFEQIKELSSFPMPDSFHDLIAGYVKNRHGLLLAAGPTASGKTTFLYSIINALRHQSLKIITMEDPVESRLGGVNQINIDPENGMDFKDVIRSSLRQNPDVLLVGEIRDPESAHMAMRSALTGTSVLSTVHTPKTKDVLVRLLDLELERPLMATSMEVVISPRLMNRSCPHCANERKLKKEEIDWIKSIYRSIELPNLTSINVLHNNGCTFCQNTGSVGLVSVVEILKITDELRDAISRGDDNLDAQITAAIKPTHFHRHAVDLLERQLVSWDVFKLFIETHE